jgi:hypothetical protein
VGLDTVRRGLVVQGSAGRARLGSARQGWARQGWVFSFHAKGAKMSRFSIARPDGRSNADVLIALIENAEVGSVFNYDQLAEALSYGSKRYTKAAVLAAVNSCKDRICRETQRALRNVPNNGYRIIPAAEHRELAKLHNDRANCQVRRGMTILRNVKWDEMNEQERLAHQGTLLILDGFFNLIQAERRKRATLEDLFARHFPDAS